MAFYFSQPPSGTRLAVQVTEDGNLTARYSDSGRIRKRTYVFRLHYYNEFISKHITDDPFYTATLGKSGIWTVSISAAVHSVFRKRKELLLESHCVSFFNAESRSRYYSFLSSTTTLNAPIYFGSKEPFLDFVLLVNGPIPTNNALEAVGFVCAPVTIGNQTCALLAPKAPSAVSDGRVLYSGYHFCGETFTYGMSDISFNTRVQTLFGNTGGYSLVAIEGTRLTVTGDYFGLTPLYYYQDGAFIAISNRLHALLVILRGLDCRLTLNSKEVLAYLSTTHFLADHPLTNKTLVNEINIVDIDQQFVISADRFAFEPSALATDRAAYAKCKRGRLLNQAKKEIQDNLTAVLASKHFSRRCLDLTGGLDSRVVFAALQNLPPDLRYSVKINSAANNKADFAVADSLASFFGYTFDFDVTRFQSINPESATLSLRQHLELHESLYMGKGLDPVILWFGLLTKPQDLHLNGGLGELYRPYLSRAFTYYRHGLRRIKLNDLVNDFAEKRKYGEFLCPYLSAGRFFIDNFANRLSQMPSAMPLRKLDLLYLYSRNRFHFCANRDAGYRTISISPYQSKSAFHAFASSPGLMSDGCLIFSLLDALSPDIARFAFSDAYNNEQRAARLPGCSNIQPINPSPSPAYMTAVAGRVPAEPRYEAHCNTYREKQSMLYSLALDHLRLIASEPYLALDDTFGLSLFTALNRYRDNSNHAESTAHLTKLYIKLSSVSSILRTISHRASP